MTTTEPGLRGFLSPFEVPAPDGCEGWEAMYPYYALFSDERRESERGAWMVPRRDALPRADVPVRLRHGGLAVHVPRPGQLPDLRGPAGARDRSPRALRLGLHERQSRHRPGEIGRRAQLFGRRAGFYFQNWDELYGRWRTKVEETIERARGARGSRAAGHRERGRGHRGTRRSARRTRCSSRTTACSRASTASGSTTSSSSTSGTPPTSSSTSSASRASPTSPTRRSPRWSAASTSSCSGPTTSSSVWPGARSSWRSADAVEAAETEDALDAAAVGVGRGPRSGWPTGSAAKQPWFHYSNGNGFYHHHRSWIDDPAVPLAHRALHRGASQAGEDIARPLDEVTAERDRITADYRALLPTTRPAPHSTRTSGLARTVFPYVESHNFYVEHWYHTLFWNKVREFGDAARAPRLPRRLGRTSSTCSATRSPTRSSTYGSRGPPDRRAAARLLAADRGAAQADHGRDARAGRRRPRSARCPRRSPNR